MTAHDPSLARQETGGHSWSRPDNRFVPLRACDLSQALSDDASRFAVTSEQVRDFTGALEQVIDREAGAFERRLADAYARFNPDRDTRLLDEGVLPTEADYEALNRQLGLLLDKANFEELDDVQIAQAVMRARTRNLSVRVDPSRVELLRIWVRGRGTATKVRRRKWRPWSTESIDVPLFKRLVVVARLKGDPYVILKLFKDIPEAEAEALLPHAEVTMSIWDRIKLVSTGAGTLGITVSKILKIAIGFAALWKLAWILVIGLGTLGFRAALGYRNARINRNWQRTQHLYFQNLGNNASALQLLVATVKQEEFKEVLLAYLVCQSSGPIERAPLCRQIESYLLDRFGLQVDFDIEDAVDKLERLGLLTHASSMSVPAINEATQSLRDHCTTHLATSRILDCD